MGFESWPHQEASSGVGYGTVTLIDGTSFCISEWNGEIARQLPHGAFYRDTRVVSDWRAQLNGWPIEPLSAIQSVPYAATFLGRGRIEGVETEPSILIRRDRSLGGGLREHIRIRNLGLQPVECVLTVEIDADFADLFEVKAGSIRRAGRRSIEMVGDALLLARRHDGRTRGVRVEAADAVIAPNLLTFRAHLPAKGEWRTWVKVKPMMDEPSPSDAMGFERSTDLADAARRTQEWRQESPVLVDQADERINQTLRRSRVDLGSLRVFDTSGEPIVAAGAPWFMAPFGRDSAITSLMAMPLGLSLPLGTARTLARYQGVRVDPESEEEPGRIFHEIRRGADPSLALGRSRVYYGTADATPLFVMLVGALYDWGAGERAVRDLLPNVDRALEWAREYGDRDDDGFVEYQRTSAHGLGNQGWKDSWDGINFADGRVAEAPIALCEVQGYAYAALKARAAIARDLGESGAEDLERRAADLKQRFNQRFWLADRGWYAMGLDGDKRPIDALASNMGHCLWTGIVDDEKAGLVADRLLSPESFSGWGVRTLASNMGAYNPVSYHNGSVWPHDTTLAVGGLARYGFVEHAQRVASALLSAARQFDGRLPELMCGFDRREYPVPVPYPTSCSPQAWASASPVMLVAALLGAQPSIPHRRIRFAPALPPEWGALHIENLYLAGSRISIHAERTSIEVQGLPDDIELVLGS